MKEHLMATVIIITVLILVVGCTQTPPIETDTNEMAQESDNEMMTDKVTVEGYIDLTAEETKMLIETTPDLLIIDVSPKYDSGHLPGALNYYVGDGSLDAAIPILDKSKPYLVYCHVDSASIAGATKLLEAGFKPVYRLEGNYAAWVDAGYPVEK